MNTRARPLRDVTEEAIAALHERLGVADTVRFLGQFTLGQGNYTEERKQLFRGMSLEDIVAGIRERRDYEDG